jgi:SAM-dependent methyltransferase
MNSDKALWEKGDFTRIAENTRIAGDTLVESFGVTPGMTVLDLACGDGTTALPAAQRGAEVLGVDIARNLVEAGNRRAREADLTNIRFLEGDACDLQGLADDSFDLTISIFGAMFASRPLDVARQMVRVTRPGGRIIMGNWIPGDPTLVAQTLKIVSTYVPPPPGAISPMSWGIESEAARRFTAAGIPRGNIQFLKDTFAFNLPHPPSVFLGLLRDYYGPTMNAFEAARQNGRSEALQQELEALFESQNRSTDPSTTAIAATFLRVTVIVP